MIYDVPLNFNSSVPVDMNSLQHQSARPDRICIHTQAAKFSLPRNRLTAMAIHDYHVIHRGYKAIGYNIVIELDRLVLGRPVGIRGAHCPEGGYNSMGIGICLVGGLDDFNQPSDAYNNYQWTMLKEVVQVLANEFGIGRDLIQGHRDVLRQYGSAPKACPCFDVQSWLSDIGMFPENEEDRLSCGSNVVPPRNYIVNPGDGIYTIHRKTGVPIAKILQLNGFTMSTVIHPGQTVKLEE